MIEETTDPSRCPDCGMDGPVCCCDYESSDDDCELDEHEEAMCSCHGFFESQSPNAVFVCGAAGSEDCDECPMYEWLGLTNRQIDALEEEHDER